MLVNFLKSGRPFILGSIFFCQVTFAQQRTDTTSTFNGSNNTIMTPVTMVADWIPVAGKNDREAKLLLQGIRIKNSRLLKLTVQFRGADNRQLAVGGEVYFHLDDGNKIKLTNIRAEQTQYGRTSRDSYLTGTFTMSASDELSLMNKKVTRIIVKHDQGSVYFNLKKDEQIALQKVILLIK